MYGVCTFTCLSFRFVNHPKKGLKFLQEKGLVGKSPKEVAQFFHEDDRLDKVCRWRVLRLVMCM